MIALLPTGGGKSICFQVPALMKEGICVVVSPLLALMQDQVNNLQQKGIPAFMLKGGISYSELDQALDNCIFGKYKFLYLSPERLNQELVQERIRQMNVSFLVVDEAHCISEWGHDFRPAYQQISDFKNLQPEVKTIALTATATQKVVEDIQKFLEIPRAKIIKQSFNRENISLLTEKFEDKNYKLLQFLQQNSGSTIIYVRNRNATQELANFLKSHKIEAAAFHGGLNNHSKEQLLQNWLSEKIQVMIATTAFGMGIDKANVRNIVHYHLPESLESFYQEAGRAGRDGQAAKALLLYHEADVLRLKNQFLKILPTVENVRWIYKKINSYFSIPFGEGEEQLYNFNFIEFCKTYELHPGKTYQILQLLDRAGIFNFKKEYHQRLEITFKVSPEQVDYFSEENQKYFQLLQVLTRNYSGIFENFVHINKKDLQYKSALSSKEIQVFLQQLKDQEIIDLRTVNQDTSLFMLKPREDFATINPLIPYIQQQYKNKAAKVNSVINYIENNEVCKMAQLLSYFGETKVKPCGKCSVCRAKKSSEKINKKKIAKHLLSLIKTNPFTSRELISQTDYDEEIVLEILQLLKQKNIIFLSPKKTYLIK